MSLPIYVAQEKWQDFDDAWTEAMTSDAPVDELLVALRLAGDRKRISRCIPLVRQHVELLQEAGRHGDAACLLGAALLAGGPPAELSTALLETSEKAWSDESWWPRRVEVTGFGPDTPDLRKSWLAFSKLQSFHEGTIIYHAGGWGTGVITEVRDSEGEIHVRFTNGRTDHFPMRGATDIFEALPETDLRAMHFRDADDLAKRLKRDHLEILRAVVERYYGRATLAAIKNALAQVKIEGSAWSAWWRKTRKLAQNSEWFRVSGSGTRMEVRLRLIAADPVQQLEQQLSNLGTLEEVVQRARDLIEDKTSNEACIELALEKVEEMAENEEEPEGGRLAAWMFLRDRRKKTPAHLLERMAAALGVPAPLEETEAPALWQLFHKLPTTRDQEQAVELLIEVLGEEAWVDEAVRNLPHAAPGMVRLLIDRVAAAGRKADLSRLYAHLLTRPLRSPHVLTALARLAERGKLEGTWPPKIERAQALVTLATHLYAARREDTQLGRTHLKLVELLAGSKSPVLNELLDDADHHALHSIQLQLQRGVEESIDNLVTSIAVHALPPEGEVEAEQFWAGDMIWTTRSGLTKQSKELEHILRVKMPENEDAIGRAASMGDLSENAEWEAAIEEKRNLTSRAASMKEDIDKAALLEDAAMPEGTVCPGTAVRYRDLDLQQEFRITLLGPWDSDKGEDVVSYRAPLAQGMLGLHAGDTQTVTLPGGEVKIQVVAIEHVDIA